MITALSNIWPYILKVSISFILLYGIYWVLFKNKTFHTTNRLILIAILLSSITIPLLEFTPKPNTIYQTLNNFEFGAFNGFVGNVDNQLATEVDKSLTWISIFNVIYLIGLIYFSVRFFFYLTNILVLRYRNRVKKDNKLTLIYTKNNLPPFSFFHWVFLPEDEFKTIKNHPIIDHENVHAKQWHSFDLILTELFCIFLWFVPFVYSFKNSIKSVHEFLADNKVASKTNSKAGYLKLLANETEKYMLIGLSSNFYCKTLKKRITMITKHKSSKLSKLQYLILLPVFALLIQSFSVVKNFKTETTGNYPTSSKSDVPSIIPIKGDYKISSEYGMRMHPIKKKEMMHTGIDLKAKTGTPVVATADGIVIKSEFLKDTYGKVVVIKHNDTYTTLYSQLSEMKVEVGNKVKQGHIIGLVGSSGMSTGPHLHYEVRKDGEKVNPANYFIN